MLCLNYLSESDYFVISDSVTTIRSEHLLMFVMVNLEI